MKRISASAIPAPSIEMQLLRCCIQAELNAQTIQSIQHLISQGVDWSQLIRLAIAHGTTPILYKRLSESWPQDRDTQELSQVRAYCQLNTFRNLKLAGELQSVLSLLGDCGIKAIAFKGPSLAVLAYGDLSLRQFSDLDILIDGSNFLRARDLLLSAGFVRSKPLHSRHHADWQDLSIMRAYGEYSVQSRDGSVNIDLHSRLLTGLIPILPTDLAPLQDDLQSVLLLNGQVETLSTENLLLYLCIHGAKDFWKKLSWVCDIAALIQSVDSIDWQQVIRQAEALKCEQLLCLGLSLARDISRVSLPEIVTDYLSRTFQLRSLSLQVQQRLLSGVLPEQVENFYLKRFYFYGQLQGGLGNQLSYYGRYLPTFLRDWRANRAGMGFYGLGDRRQ